MALPKVELPNNKKSGWWYAYPAEKYEFASLDHHPNYWGK